MKITIKPRNDSDPLDALIYSAWLANAVIVTSTSEKGRAIFNRAKLIGKSIATPIPIGRIADAKCISASNGLEARNVIFDDASEILKGLFEGEGSNVENIFVDDTIHEPSIYPIVCENISYVATRLLSIGAMREAEIELPMKDVDVEALVEKLKEETNGGG